MLKRHKYSNEMAGLLQPMEASDRQMEATGAMETVA